MAGQRAADARQCMGPAPARVAPAPPLRDARGSQHPVCGAVTEALSWLFCCALVVGAGLLLAGARAGFPHDLRGALGYWSLGLVLVGISGWLLRSELPSSGHLGGFVMVLGWTSGWRAWLAMARLPVPNWLPAPALLLIAGLIAPQDWWPDLRTLAQLLVVLGCISALRERRLDERPGIRHSLLGLLAATALLELFVLGLSMTDTSPGPHEGSDAALWTRLLMPMMLSLGFLLLCVERLQSKLERAAAIDPQTGLLNRRSFSAAGDRAVARARSDAAKGCAVAVIDIDFFKRVNDRFGQPAGDLLLQHVAAHMLEGARHHDLLGRLGGEEFALLLEGVDGATAQRAAERLRRNVESHVMRLEGEPVPVTVSVGVALLEATDRDFDDLLRRADRATLKAKSAGRNRIELARP